MFEIGRYVSERRSRGRDDASTFDRELREILRRHGCAFDRPTKGSHKLWFSPISKRSFVVPAGIKSRHTANEVLKQVGLPNSV